MVLNKYEKIGHKVNRSKPYIDVKHKVLVCRVKPKLFYSFVRRLNNLINEYEYFLIFTNESVDEYLSVNIDTFGRYKLYIGHIWKYLNITETKDFNVELCLVENDDMTDVYALLFDIRP